MVSVRFNKLGRKNIPTVSTEDSDIVIPYEGFATEEYNDVPIILVTGTTEFSFFNQSDESFGKIKDEDLRNKAISFSNRYGSDMYRIFNTEMSAEQMSFQGIFIPMLSDDNGYTSIFGFAKHAGYQDMSDKFNAYLANFLASGNPNGTGLTEWKPWIKTTHWTLRRRNM